MKKILTLILMLLASASMAQQKQTAHNYTLIRPSDDYSTIISKAAHVTPSPRQLRWQELELVAFLHFGINTFTGREWGTGGEDPRLFNPSHLNAEQWIRVLKKAGFKQVILTAKHHDGFCLWPSRYTDHSVKSSPWENGKGDVVRDVAEACKKYHMGFGVYLSPWDRNCPFYGDTRKYNRYFEEQLTELLTHYGKIDEVWFDGANGTGPNGKKPVYNFDAWYSLIRRLQPGAVIAVMGPDVRWVGTETGYGRLSEWSVVPGGGSLQQQVAARSQHQVNFKPVDMTDPDLGSREKILKAKSLRWYPAEADVSIRPGWFYHASQDTLVKSPQKLLDIYYGSVGRNCVLLLNVPPDTDGMINSHDIKNLMEWKRLIDETFRDNLAEKAKIVTENGLDARGLIDGDYDTYWTTKGRDTTAVIDFDLQGSKTFDVLLLQEEITVGQRIEKFELDYLRAGQWTRAVAGTTVGYKRLLRFPAVTASKVRLRIESSRLNPTLASFGLYLQPQSVR